MEEIREQLKMVIKRIFDVDFEPEVTVAPEGTGADFASNAAMKLTRELHKNPMEIAEAIAAEIPGAMAAKPGFLNFMLSDEYFWAKMADFGGNFEKNISPDEYLGKKVICEFSDPNPFKVLHVGHLYTSVVGDAISRLFELSGAKVVRANFGGDVGLHVAKTMWALLEKEEFSIEDIAKCYVEGTKAYEENEQAKQEIVALNKEIYRIAQTGEKETELAKMYWRGRELSYKYFEDFYDSIGVKFDRYYPESTVAERGLAEVKNGLEKAYMKKAMAQ